ncbi:MAG TPA: nucleotidyl transferase AbiEii/AbiGii toxin family protein [Acidobacteriota bacterium]|nr:nucleotidyl transferase AbiEii/AbiGii toxin family protein [Acidobacteriota bacterium]
MSVYRPVFEALDQAGVRFVVVGGLAVVLHGRARFTADVDLVLDLSPQQAGAAIDALEGLGLRPRLPVAASDFADPQRRQQWIEERGMDVFTLWDPSNPLLVIDLFARAPLPFRELWAEACVKEFVGLQVKVASLQHLIAMKRRAGRAIDLEDLRFLETLSETGEEKDDGS